MIELGKRDEIFGIEMLVKLSISGKPTSMPSVPDDHSVMCGFDQGLGEKLYVCESLEDMQHLYDSYAKGMALRITWYSGPDPGFLHTMPQPGPGTHQHD